MTPTWHNEFELPDSSYSVSDFEDYIEFIIKKHETLTAVLLIIFTSIELTVDQRLK